jgi:uracil-DNA glycosylase
LSQSPEPNIHPSWYQHLNTEFDRPYMQSLRQFLREQYRAKKQIYPKKEEYFAALNRTPLNQVKAVIIGQDPYHGPGQAHGLCFSVRKGIKTPPSLVNIFKEIQRDMGINNHGHGDLSRWATQGVLLLNSVLTVEAGKAASHSKKGWEQFTDRVVEVVNRECAPTVFMLWGSYAQKKASEVDRGKHLILTSPHPSPLSAHRGFLGCGHFSRANQFLIENGRTPIDWELPLNKTDEMHA